VNNAVVIIVTGSFYNATSNDNSGCGLCTGSLCGLSQFERKLHFI
jgi:hypothetical protein